MDIKVVNKSSNPLPEYAHPTDAGLDLRADLTAVNTKFLFNTTISPDGSLSIHPGGRALIPTNLFTAIPEGYEAQIRPRSGLALKQGLTVLNSPGTIDANYRNGWGVILINFGDNTAVIKQGDRIAQAVLNKVEHINWIEVDSLDETDRNLGGFGSSGKS